MEDANFEPADRQPRLVRPSLESRGSSPIDTGLAGPPTEVTPETTPKKPRGGRKKLLKIAIFLLVLAGAGYAGAHFIHEMMLYESTDDAFVAAHVHTITSKVPGMVNQVLVDDHQEVKKGDLLVKLDARDYEAQVRIAHSNNIKASRDMARMKLGHSDYDPDEEGNVEGVDLNDEDSYAPDEQKVVDEYQANASQSSNELRKALLNIEYTSIRAPEGGRIGKRSVETGQVVGAGQALMALVEPNPWINANFKETQLGRIRVGQDVDVRIDAIPDHHFKGKVQSIAAASGATYSLLPPDNATGNFTKVVQRVPVKIVFDPESVKGYEDRIAAGMSTEVSVRVRP